MAASFDMVRILIREADIAQAKQSSKSKKFFFEKKNQKTFLLRFARG